MIFEKFIDSDLGHVSYIVGCENTKEAFIVDPRRDIKEYEKFIEKHSLTLKYVFNTHTHADYVGGHLELANKYNIDNIFQHSVPITNFEIIKVKENDIFQIGNTIIVKVLETPGHTPFDICLLVEDNKNPYCLFSGDILFIGDMGRPDLLGEENEKRLARQSYDSARKLWSLDDEMIVYPSHIKGSLCGSCLSEQYSSTIAQEKLTNKSFQFSQKPQQKYVDNLLSQKIETPDFFKKMAGTNIEGTKLIGDILQTIDDVNFDQIKDLRSIQIIDLREPNEFHQKHIKNSINISLSSNVSLIAGTLLDYEKDIYLYGADCDEFIIKLLRVGLDNIKGIIIENIEDLDQNNLSSSKMVTKKEIDENFRVLTLDKNLSKFKELEYEKNNKIIFICENGYKSASLGSYLNYDNLYFLGE